MNLNININKTMKTSDEPKYSKLTQTEAKYEFMDLILDDKDFAHKYKPTNKDFLRWIEDYKITLIREK